MKPPPDVRRLAAARATSIAARSVPPIEGCRFRRLQRTLEAVVMEEEYQHALEDMTALREALGCQMRGAA